MMRRPLFIALVLSVAAVALARADQSRFRSAPGLGPRAVDTSENSMVITNMGTEEADSKIMRILHLADESGWETGPTAPGLSFWHPQAFAIDAAGRLYVSDRNNRRIVRMENIAGDGWIEFSGTGGERLADPGTVNGTSSDTGVYGLALDAAERIYITAFKPGRLIRVDNMTGAGWRTFDGLLPSRSVTLDKQGRIYLTDNQRHRILRMDDMSGAGLVTLGSLGNGERQFKQTYAIAFDAQGRIYATDEDNNRIVRMNDMTGAGWTTFGTFGSGVGNLRQPHAVDIDAAGRIWIADTNNHRIVRINSMAGDGWVSFGTLEMQGRGLRLAANKYLEIFGTGPALTYPAVHPHVPAGDRIRTTLYGVNLEAGAADLATSFLTWPTNPRCDGNALDCSAPFPVRNGGQTSNEFAGTMAPLGTTRLEATLTGARRLGYARARSSAWFTGGALVQTTNGATIVGSAMIPAWPPQEHSVVYVDNTGGARTVVTITLPPPYGPSIPRRNGAQITVTLRDTAGATAGETTLNFQPGEQRSFAVSDIFPVAGGGFAGTLDISSGNGRQTSAVAALRYENGGEDVFTLLPSLLDIGNPLTDFPIPTGGHAVLPRDETTTRHFPHIGDGDSYRTNFFVVNPWDTATVARLDFYRGDGAALSLPIDGQPRTTYSVALPPRGAASITTDGTSAGIQWGWARVTATQRIDGAAIVQRVSEGRIAAEGAVFSSRLARRHLTYIVNTGTTESAIAIANPNQSLVTATFTLRNTNGDALDATTATLPPGGYMAQFVRQLFPVVGEVEGTIDVETNGPSIAAIGLRYDNPGGTVFTTVPTNWLP